MKNVLKLLVAAGLISAAVGASSVYAAEQVQQEPQQTDTAKIVEKFAKGKAGIHIKGHLPMFGEELFTLLDITAEEFRTQLEEGKTLKEIAEAKGVSEAKLTEFLTEQQTKALDNMKADIPTAVEHMLTNEHRAPFHGGGKVKIKMRGQSPEAVEPPADVKGNIMMGGPRMMFGEGLLTLLNISTEDFRTQLHEGKTLKEIAAAQGVTEEKLKAFLVEEQTRHIEQMKADLPAMVKDMITKEMNFKFHHGGGKFRFDKELPAPSDQQEGAAETPTASQSNL